MRLENNLLYGDPRRIIAMGTDKNLVQGAQPNEKTRRDERKDPIRELEEVLKFSYGGQLKKETSERQRKKVWQAGIPVCEKKLSILRKLLGFTGVI